MEVVDTGLLVDMVLGEVVLDGIFAESEGSFGGKWRFDVLFMFLRGLIVFVPEHVEYVFVVLVELVFDEVFGLEVCLGFSLERVGSLIH